VLRIVADLGNTRFKWSRLDDRGQPEPSVAFPVDDPSTWTPALIEGSSWAIASVNPPASTLLADQLSARKIEARWFRSGSDVPVRHALGTPHTTGADRALAVAAAIQQAEPGQPGHVILCGTAVTVEHISPEGVWLGGAIFPGLGMLCSSLHARTAQLPAVRPRFEPQPQPWGDTTQSALEAGIYWGLVGAIREILARQSMAGGGGSGAETEPWVLWSGGDAPELASSVQGTTARVVPDLVLHGLAALGFSPGHSVS
jgi:type III pantothenate kinase